MIELLEGLPDQVVGIEAVGTVVSEDYDLVVKPAVERALASHAKIRLLHVIGERFERHTASALWEDTALGISDVKRIDRIAVVTDVEHFRALIKGAGWAFPGELRLFSNAERARAIAWIGEGIPAPAASSNATAPG